MLYFRRSRFIRFVVLPLTFVALVSACRKTVIVEYPPPYEELALEEPGIVTVTLDDGSQMRVHNPWIEADSLVGTVYDARNRAYTDTVRVALTEIARVEEKTTHLPTAGKVVVWTSAAFVLGVLIYCATADRGCFDLGDFGD